MRFVSADEIDRVLDFPALTDALADAFAQPPVQPVRHHHVVGTGRTPENMLLLMPAWEDASKVAEADRDTAVLGVKIVTVAPHNGERGMPAVMGSYLLMNAITGTVLAVMDGPRLTLWRTAAASALAARLLARADASVLAMLGAGALSPFLIRAHASVRPIREVRIWNRSRGAAERLAASMAQEGFSVSVAASADAAVDGADIVSAATLSTEPLVRGAHVKPGAHIDLVGAFTPAMRESDDAAVAMAEVHVDTRAGALKEGGDLVQAIASGAFAAKDVRSELQELLTGRAKGRSSPQAVTLFKSVGAALEDLAAAKLVWRAIN
jgi:ornithine cyclodeaminase/alanine dehydrogenase-like protein (mu-crystallin family)